MILVKTFVTTNQQEMFYPGMELLFEKFGLSEGDCKVKVTECHLQEIARNCCSNWKWLQPHLNMRKIAVDDISGKHIDAIDKRLDFFHAWTTQEGSDATYLKLIHALLKIDNKNDAEFVCMLLKKPLVVKQGNVKARQVDSTSQKPDKSGVPASTRTPTGSV